MPRNFFDPTPEQQNIVLIDAMTLSKEERLVESCEYCNPAPARYHGKDTLVEPAELGLP
jgi:hypothetical protein